MSGGSKKVTVGYWYRMLFGYGWCKGPIDAFLEMRGGGRTAWKGLVTETSRIYVNALNLWGGEKREGGLQGYFDVQLGEADQGVNDYLRTRLGRDQPTYRGKAIGVWRGGRYGAMNPYPKRLEFKVRRILRGWDGDQPWYPEKAEVVILDGSIALLGRGWEYQVETFSEPNTVWNNFTAPTSGWQMGGEMPFSTNGMAGGQYWTPTRSNIWLRRQMHVKSSGVTMHIAADNGCVVWVNGINVGSSNPTNASIPGNENNPVSHQFSATGTVEVLVKAFAEVLSSDEAGNIVTLAFTGPPLYGMNPAHILYDSLTASDMQGEPVGMINEDSFIAAADQLFQEGFGLCTTYDPDAETVEEFQQRICNVIGASLTQSRINGQYYLDLIRDDDTEDLPIITADDIIELKWEPVPLTELVNQITVEWFDPERKEHRSTPPVQSLGAIRAAGRPIPEVMRYPEIPSETLALRVAARDLQARSTPLIRFTLTTNRRRGIWALRPGRRFRLQSPQDGFADIVCVLGDIDVGTLTSGRITIKAVQDVFGMPDTVYVEAEAGQAPPQNLPPAASPHQRLIEAPYVELVTNMSSSELAAFPDDAGAIMAMASQPLSGLNYSLWSGAEGAELEDNGSGDWCPVARVVEEADYLDTEFTLTAGSNLEDVVLGSWALWEEEIVRVDAIDPVAMTLTIGRGCADTVPHKHDANSLIYFCGDWGATDDVQYVDGETVTAKLLTRTSSAELSIDEAAELTVEMLQRQFRPYPPAGVLINDEHYPEEVVGDVRVTWAHRDRVMQADKLMDDTQGGIGPEPGTTYTLEVYDDDTSMLASTQTDIEDDETTIPGSVMPDHARVMLWAVRDGLRSWQAFNHAFLHGFEIIGMAALTACNLETFYSEFSVPSATPPVTWSLCGGGLPAGIHVVQDGSSTCSLSGVPSASIGYYSTTLRVEDATGQVAELGITIGVANIINLLHFDGPDGSTSIVDETGALWSRFGRTHIDEVEEALGGAEAYFDGNGDYLSLPDTPTWHFAADDFYIEGFVTPQFGPDPFGGIVSQRTNDSTRHALTLQLSTVLDQLQFTITSGGNASTTGHRVESGVSIAYDERNFFRVGRRGTEIFLQYRGVENVTAISPAFSQFNSDQAIRIGRLNGSGTPLQQLRGWLDEFKVARGVAPPLNASAPSDASDYPQVAPVLAVSGSLPPGSSSAAYSSTSDVQIHGAATPFSVSVSGGGLPGDWIATVSGSNVQITGSAVSAGEYTFTLDIEDDNSNVVSLPVTVVITD